MAEQENVTLIQKIYTAFSSGDIQTILNNVDSNAEWINHGPAAVPHMEISRDESRHFSKPSAIRPRKPR